MCNGKKACKGINWMFSESFKFEQDYKDVHLVVHCTHE